MASNYEAICEDNRKRYGTDIGRIGPMLLADRYDDRTHFIFELLQNAEDALGKRGEAWRGPRRLTFRLSPGMLKLSHFGRPFDEGDVRGVCGIAQSTKDEFSIGRFGIGFKSVYTFTDRPEIHSGEEDFAVENYVLPRRAAPADRAADETQILLPLKPDDPTAQQEIEGGLKRLGPGALLFLRHIDEINWSVSGSISGTYLRSSPIALGSNVQRITVIGQESGQPEVDQTWLVFHRTVPAPGKTQAAGRVEVAFSLQSIDGKPDRWSVVPIATSPLVVFFPTAVETNLGFLVQGPYRTTPSRDNVPRHDAWNRHLVDQTALLLVEAMRWLRDHEMLDVSSLNCLPLDRSKFADGSMFESLFAETRAALLREPLLPRFGGGYVAASGSKLARTQELRQLFSPQQVAQLFGVDEAAWLAGDITQDRAPEVRQYVMRELAVTEVTPETLAPRLSQAFLEAQSDSWIESLYHFLSGLPALRRRLDSIPLVRLADGSHVVASVNGEPQAFLPSSIETGFPTVRKAVCAAPEARALLIAMGITEPDLVDDVVLNVLQKYRGEIVDVDDDQYAKDIDRILTAFNTDSKTQREKLLAALRSTAFVMAVESKDGTECVARPSEVYIAADKLKRLFAGVPGITLVDDAYPCLRGEQIRELLEACGGLRYLRPVTAPKEPYWSDRLKELRIRAGHPGTSGYSDHVEDWLLEGVEGLLSLLPQLEAEQRTERARLLWESLGDLEDRRSRAIFEGKYSWSHHGKYTITFPSAFVRRLNEAAWVPGTDGSLCPPRLVTFDSLGWKPNPFLLTQIEFKPPLIDQLAKEAGIDPAAIDLLRRCGITSLAELATRLGIDDNPPLTDAEKPAEPTETETSGGATHDVYAAAKDLYGRDLPEIRAATPDPDGGDGDARLGAARGRSGSTKEGSGTVDSRSAAGQFSPSHYQRGTSDQAGSDGSGSRHDRAKTEGSRPFISYVGARQDEEEPDPDGLDHAARMTVENHAVEQIVAREPLLRRTPDGNPGFDLFEADASGKPVRWVEVKSMTGSLADRPVGLSRPQFDFAREKGAAYWLYVVEYASDAERVRILRIQDPVALTRTFTFDQGWAKIAHVSVE